MSLRSLNWIYEYGLHIIENNDVEQPTLLVPSNLFEKLKRECEDEDY